ncbi:hypothetical protein A8709_11170 [Paenibacillus pectinilyticus]|uniref:PQ-loop repeat-containing protein n=1 Tax=Paenibacillus pectinilyticus TaxID=512399 RepID=A0A1C1A2Q5_9BACL|nr:PQ-loop domain-containing transporter [Paenibacillus pectinilyticus]OCT14733.1 hypothetical protein A8709_11170 [Paenibacillus pectinilyticus]
MIFNIVQVIGGFILAIGNIPQILQLLRTKSAKDLNGKTFLFMFIGMALMEVYAVQLAVHDNGGAFLFTNTLSLLSLFIINVLLLKYRNR